MQPTCGPIIRDTPKHIIGWLPQSASPNWPPEVPRDPGTIMREIEGTCKCRSILTHVCTHGWPLFAAVWRREIRAAAERYSVAHKRVLVSSGSKTQKFDLDDAVIHFRCGDLMEMDASRGPLNSGFVPLSVLLRYLRPLAPRFRWALSQHRSLRSAAATSRPEPWTASTASSATTSLKCSSPHSKAG